MKNLIVLLSLVILGPGLTGCGQNDKKRASITPRQSRGAGLTPVVNDPTQSNFDSNTTNTATGDYGQITKGSGSQDQFDAAVRAFVSATIDPWNLENPELGYVSGDFAQNTGIWIRGSVKAQGGSFDINGTNKRQIDVNSSNFRIIVWDSYAGKTTSDGQVIPEYAVAFTRAKGATINYANRSALITFEDEYGMIQLNGTWDQTWFQGKVTFENYQLAPGVTKYDGPLKGTMGSFVIGTCALFNCN